MVAESTIIELDEGFTTNHVLHGSVLEAFLKVLKSVTDEPDVFRSRMKNLLPKLPQAERRVAQYIDQHRAAALASSAVDLAASTRTSDATVIRAVQALGFSGLADLKQELVKSLSDPSRLAPSDVADNMQQTLKDIGRSSDRAIENVLEVHRESLEGLCSPDSRAQMTAAVNILHRCQRIVVFGIGPSASLAGYVSLLLGRSGRRVSTLNATGSMLADQLLDLRTGDALLVLAYGRSYREVEAVFEEGLRLGLSIVLVTDSLPEKLACFASVVVPARRGRKGRVALHGATLVCLEALVMGLAAADDKVAVHAVKELTRLRGRVDGSANSAKPRGSTRAEP